MKATVKRLVPFVPSGRDFDQAIAFFGELGFAKEWENNGMAGLRFGEAYFLLQKFEVPKGQNNQMLSLEVDDLDAYWEEISPKALPKRFAGIMVKAPTEYPWGREMQIIDPGGVLWHVRQAK